MKQHRITVEKTARYFTLGEPGEKVKQVLFACHGYAQLAPEFLAGFESLASEQLLIVAPEGLHRFYARGSADKVVASWMTKEDRLDDINDYVAFLDHIYDEVMTSLPANVKVTVLGFSQGSATVSRWAAMTSKKIHELILWCGFFPPDLPPAGIPSHVKLFVVTASEDKFISPEQEAQQLDAMRKLSPGMEHTRFEGKHEMEFGVLGKILTEAD